jgi:biopolymer transport protein ExbD
MSFGSFNSQQHAVKAEINVVPLVDVMLVLLVIFIITAPLLTHSVKIDLPKASSNPNITKPDHVELDDSREAWQTFIGMANWCRKNP